MYSNINRNTTTQVVKLLATFCILCTISTGNVGGNNNNNIGVVVEAFSSPATSTTTHRHPRRSPTNGRKYRSTTITTTNSKTKLHEQPVNRKEILGPISPSTVAKYNLPPDVIAEGWSAQLVSRAATTIDNQLRESDRVLGKVTTEIQLIPKDPQSHYVGTLRVAVPIPLESPGLGIELLELEGGGKMVWGLPL